MLSVREFAAKCLRRLREGPGSLRTSEGFWRLGRWCFGVNTERFLIVPKDQYLVAPKEQNRIIPREGYVAGPLESYLLLPKNRYRLELLPGQAPLAEWGVGWLTEANTDEAYDALWGDQDNLRRFREEEKGIREVLVGEVRDQVRSKLLPAARVLDVGCGVGDLLVALSGEQPSLAIAGVDFSSRAVQGAAERLPKGEFLQHHLKDPLPYPDGGFDLVMCTDTLEHLEDPAAVITEMIRVTSPGGATVIVVPDGTLDSFLGHRWFWTLETLGQLVSSWGGAARRLPKTGELIATIDKPASAQKGPNNGC